MKKIFFTALSVFLLTVVKAQTIATGVNDLYAERFQSAKATFEKLQAANPNDIQAIYWLGQAYIEMEDYAGARSVYEKGLASSSNAPLLQAGMGQVELNQNKINEARQHFENAVTMTASKKGGDPEVLNAVGRAIANTYTDKDRRGDINYAVQKLEEAVAAKPKDNVLLADIYLNLGNAYRLAKPGENGGLAFSNYQKAQDANPNFAMPAYRMAKLFNTQHNWDLYEKYLVDAITKDPRFAPAYYDLSYYKIGKLDLPAAEDYAKKFADNSNPDPNNDYLRASILWAQKKYDDAIALGKSILSRAGDKAKPKVYKTLAYSYLSKADTLTAKESVDNYFAKEKPENIIPEDYNLRATIYSGIPGQEQEVVNSYLQGIAIDTVLSEKLDILKGGITFLDGRKQYALEGRLWDVLLQIKPNTNINDLFNAGLASYRAKEYRRSYGVFDTMTMRYPDSMYGYEWKFNNANIIDTVKMDSIALPAATALLAFAQKDTARFFKQVFKSSFWLANYYNDKVKNRTQAIEYLKLMKISTRDSAMQTSIQKNIDELSKPPRTPQPPRTPAPPRSSMTSPAKKPNNT